MKKHLIYWLAAIVIIAIGCQKELSFEGSNSPAQGSLQSDITGDCLPKTVNGTYVVGAALVPSINTIGVQLNVTKTGTFTVYTDTINGYFFRATGTFTTLGANNVTLRGNGTPFQGGPTNFVVHFDTTFCDIQVPVVSAGVGNLGGAPNACAPIFVHGGYSPGVALTAANNVDIQVDVMTPGAFTITTDTLAGIWFSFSGTLSATGPQTVTLQAQGSIPASTAPGPYTFTVKLGTGRCTFVVNIAGPAVGTLGGGPAACTPSTVFGTYFVGTPVTVAAGDSVHIEISVTTAGAYNITASTTPSTGFSFSASGIAPVGNNQTITLIGSGTPTTAGPQTFTVTFGTSTCTFVVNVLPSDYFPRTINSNWSYEWNDLATDSLYRTVITPTISALGNPFNIFMPNDLGVLDSTGNYPAGYYRRSGGDYLEWFNYGAFFQYDNPGWDQYIMLKDNVPAATNWKSNGFAGTITAVPINIRFSYTILQKDVPITINTSIDPSGKTYQNVIVVEEKYELETLPGVWTQISTGASGIGYGKSYYAKGIGLILYESYDNNSIKTDWMELRRYQVF
jgi:hypothetical protein